MKTRIPFIISLFFLCNWGIVTDNAAFAGNEPGKPTSISVFSTANLYSLTLKWADEYSGLHPEQQVSVSKVNEAELNGLSVESGRIGIISGQDVKTLDRLPSWQVVVGREVIVPVISSANPFMEEINRKGITAEALASGIENPGRQNWGTLLKNGQTVPVKYFVLDDPSVKAGLAAFLKSDPSKAGYLTIVTAEQMTTALQQDPGAIGFCRLTNVLDATGQNLDPSIRLLPIDKNGNGKLDYMEQIYDDAQTFSRGVWIGKYPQALTYDIFAVSSEIPEAETGAAFLSWVLTDGQEFLNGNGFCNLVINERQSQLDKLYPAVIAATPSTGLSSYQYYLLLALAGILVLGFGGGWVLRYLHRKNATSPVTASAIPVAFDERSIEAPKGIYFDKTHTWAFMEQDGLVKTGIDDFLMHVTGPVSRIELKNPGEKVTKGAPFITIVQQGKQLNIHSPVSGTIKAQNRDLAAGTSKLRSSPYAEGWVYRIEPANWLREIQFLFMAEKYRTWIAGEFTRLRDFLAASLGSGDARYAHVVLQDGGALKEDLLSEFGPEVWEDFQEKFLDSGN
jgi:glycine cleavage system H lipoate-binding protein/ABC-type phosphate transport system substrate-binding protein